MCVCATTQCVYIQLIYVPMNVRAYNFQTPYYNVYSSYLCTLLSSISPYFVIDMLDVVDDVGNNLHHQTTTTIQSVIMQNCLTKVGVGYWMCGSDSTTHRWLLQKRSLARYIYVRAVQQTIWATNSSTSWA